MRNVATRVRLDRLLLAWLLPWSILLRLILSISPASLAIIAVVSVVPGCSFSVTGTDAVPEIPDTCLTATPDSVLIEIAVESRIGNAEIRSLDIFLFEGSGTRQLLYFSRLDAGRKATAPVDTPGDKTVAVIANFPFLFKPESVGTLDNLETLSLDFISDSPDWPVMTGEMSFSPDCTGVCVRIQPVMSEIVLESVTNLMDGYRRLEDPYAFLSVTNPSAELFRTVGFCISEASQDSLRVFLPCDIGLFTQYPSTRLYCYPNDQPPSASNPSTVLNLCGRTGGEPRRMSFPVPPVSRNMTIRCEISFDGNSAAAHWL